MSARDRIEQAEQALLTGQPRMAVLYMGRALELLNEDPS